ncbi:MAG: hypothetical protein AAGA56_27045 [Myxococcota bacterium]
MPELTNIKAAPAEPAPPAPEAMVEGEEDDYDEEVDLDEFEVGTDYTAPMVAPDFDQPQPEGIVRVPHHKHRFTYRNLIGARVNPLGLTDRLQIGYRYQLSDSPETIFQDAYIAGLADIEVTPAFAYVGARLEYQPAAIFRVFGSYGLMAGFGTFNYLTSFNNASAEYDDATLQELREDSALGPQNMYSAVGNRGQAGATFQFALGGLGFRNTGRFIYFGLPLENGDSVMWDAFLDILVPNKGWTFQNDADLLFLTDKFRLFDNNSRVILGVRHTLTHAIYRDVHRRGTNPDNGHQRVGPLFALRFIDEDTDQALAFNQVSAFLLTQWWVEHRYRLRENHALPAITIGVQFQGDILASAKE